MRRIVECVPNFSEGRRPEVLGEIVAAMTAVPGVYLLDREMDANHHRAVVTLVGDPTPMAEAVFRGIRAAAERIDLREHRGEHPRMGATDVVPFVPIAGISMEECVALARRLGARVGEELGIPVFLYEAAASRPDRQDLAVVRSGEFEGLREAIGRDADRAPDFGPHRIHQSAGAVAIGARMPLVAFNVNLATRDLTVAQRIAEAVRFRSGGLRYVKALGFDLRDRGLVQVSMNLTNYQKSPIYRAFEMVAREAAYHGVAIVESEIVGLVPAEALLGTADRVLRLANFSAAQVLENRLADVMARAERAPAASPGAAATAAGPDGEGGLDASFLDRVAAGTPTPGGGSVSALAGALAASLGCMIANLTLGKKKYAAVAPHLTRALQHCEELRGSFARQVDEDAAAFAAVLAARRLPAGTPEEEAARAQAQALANRQAVAVPLQVLHQCAELVETLALVAEKGNPHAVSDAGVAAALAGAAARGADLNVRINLASLDESYRPEAAAKARERLAAALAGAERVLALVDEKLK